MNKMFDDKSFFRNIDNSGSLYNIVVFQLVMNTGRCNFNKINHKIRR